MIILDGPIPQKRPRSRRLSDESTEHSQFGPPSYQSDTSRFPLQPLLDSQPPPSSRRARVPNHNLGSQFRKGLFYVLAVYAVISIAVAVPYIVVHHRAEESHSPYQRMRPPGILQNSSEIPVVPVNVPIADGSVLGCNLWDYSYDYGYPDNLRYSKQGLTYCLPHNATNIWLHALGGHERLVSGQFTVKLNPDEDEQDYMVDVILTYPSDDDEARNSSAICLMRESDTWGVGIYTPPEAVNHSLEYQLTFLVPHAGGPLELPRFTTYLPWFHHTFEDLNNSLSFGDVEVAGVASPVHATISGQTVNITTSQAAITGSYRASDTLILQTSSARIDTNITLGSTVGQEHPTSLFMRSSEGRFSATVNLSTLGANNKSSSSSNSPTNPHMRPQYSTRISCEDSPITVVFRPEGTVGPFDLDVQINTTFNRAVVLLDPAFEGTFDLHSTNGTAIVADTDGDEISGPGSLSGSFPYDSTVEMLHQSISQARELVKRGGKPTGQNVNVRMQNRLALVALGFFKSGEIAPSIADFPMP